jgi:hypothetical protein
MSYLVRDRPSGIEDCEVVCLWQELRKSVGRHGRPTGHIFRALHELWFQYLLDALYDDPWREDS